MNPLDNQQYLSRVTKGNQMCKMHSAPSSYILTKRILRRFKEIFFDNPKLFYDVFPDILKGYEYKNLTGSDDQKRTILFGRKKADYYDRLHKLLNNKSSDALSKIDNDFIPSIQQLLKPKVKQK